MTILAKPVNTDGPREAETPGTAVLGLAPRSGSVREAFLQIRAPKLRPDLGDLVRRGDEHALDLYLLLWIPLSAPPFQLEVDPDYWDCLLVGPRVAAQRASRDLPSLDRLESLALLRRDTRGSSSRDVLLDESGNGDLYVHPATRHERISSSHTATGSSALITN